MVNLGIAADIQSNIVSEDKLRPIQKKVLEILADSIKRSLGPAGSNTLILHGNSDANLFAEYSKDGNKIIKNIKFNSPIEMSIQSEIEEITRYIEKTVGDGTSTAVIMSSLIFDNLIRHHLSDNPFQVIRNFKYAVQTIQERIFLNKRDCTLDDIYNIAYIATNGNNEVANMLKSVYERFGMNVYIDVSASVDENTYQKEYDGLTMEIGYSDQAFINTDKGVSSIDHPRIYAFQDAIDTPHMISYFETIIKNNILDHMKDQKYIPTVIIAPKISRDLSGLMRELSTWLHSFGPNRNSQKPPFVIISNIVGMRVETYSDIALLCGCPMIQNYIDPEVEKKQQEKGMAPTLENVSDFYGSSDLVETSASMTKFINPKDMYARDKDGNVVINDEGNPITTSTYDALISFIKSEIQKAYESGEHDGVRGELKRRLHSIQSNMIELFIGGVSISDRDSLRDLVEDAVLNCRSAANNGVGYAASYEGYHASKYCLNREDYNSLHEYFEIINSAYDEYLRLLYGTIIKDVDELDDIIEKIESDDKIGPLNIHTMEFDKKVITSISSDDMILDTISKIITIMFTANQALVQAPNINNY